MQNQMGGFNPREVIDSIRQFVGTSFGPTAQTQQSVSQEAKRRAVFAVLLKAPKNLAEIELSIRAASAGTYSPKASEILNILETAKGEGLIASKAKGDRKIYSLTEAGEAVLNEPVAAAEAEHQNTSSPSFIPKNLSIDPAIVAGAKLATAVTAVAQGCDREQKEAAAKILDDARRKLYAILAKD